MKSDGIFALVAVVVAAFFGIFLLRRSSAADRLSAAQVSGMYAPSVTNPYGVSVGPGASESAQLLAAGGGVLSGLVTAIGGLWGSGGSSDEE